MKINEFRKLIKEEVDNILKETDLDVRKLPHEPPKSIMPQSIAEYIKGAITPDMDGARIFNLIGHALTRYFSNDSHYKGKVKTVVWNYLNSERHEDYVPEVFDALLQLGVKWQRETGIKESTDAFGDDERQFNMSFGFTAKDKNEVLNQFKKAQQKEQWWKNIKQIKEWIENVGFKDMDDAFYWLENMYDASKIQPGEAVAFHYSPNGWILAAKEAKQLKEYIKSGNELEILLNAADDINTQYFKGRGQIDRSNYRMAVRETVDNVLDILEKNTKVIKKTKGFTAKEDEEREYYQLPEFNVAIALDSYKVSRATVIQFLSFDGEKPLPDKVYETVNSNGNSDSGGNLRQKAIDLAKELGYDESFIDMLKKNPLHSVGGAYLTLLHQKKQKENN